MKRVHLDFQDDNSMHVAEKYPKQWQIFEPFAVKYPYACLQMDGFADEHVWVNQKLKIMTFLKESYRYCNKNFISHYILDVLNEKEFAQLKAKDNTTWIKVFKWINAIRQALGEQQVSNLNSIAHMNLSKIAADANIRKDTPQWVLNEALQEDGQLLYNQFKSINPNIVICGNNFDYFLKMLKDHSATKPDVQTVFEEEIDGKRPLYIYVIDGHMIVFSAYHPASNKTSEDVFVKCIEENFDKLKFVIS